MKGMKVRIGKWVVFLRATVKVINTDDAVIGINSGAAFAPAQWLFLDYDEYYPEEEFTAIVKDNSCRRGIIVESTPGKYQALSFTPIPTKPKLLGIVWDSSADANHKAFMQKNGFSTLRVTQKKGFKPIVRKVIINKEGKNFYDYNSEKAYLKLINAEVGE